MGTIRELQREVRKYNRRADVRLLERAYEFASSSHVDQYRESGEDFIQHPLGVAEILAELQLDTTTITAGLLHDVVEDTDVTMEKVRSEFGDEVADLIDGVTKLGQIKFRSHAEHQAENLRKMLIAMTKDIRVMIIKLADRLHNMRTLCHLAPEKQKDKARETMEIYAPLANRLGMSQLKWELEDLSFFVLEPKKYAQIQKMVNEKREERQAYVDEASNLLKSELGKVGVKCDISGRPKHFYSIHRKMVERGKEFNEIYDLSALRVVVDSLKDCYASLGAIHSLWKPVPGRFKDYVAMPKFNMYQSLHTTVIGPMGRPLEIQIRTKKMDRTAEVGIAAHWRYKEGLSSDKFDARLSWLREMLEWQTELRDPREFMESLKINLFEDEVFVFTPNGDVIGLTAGATPLDFAYHVHTEVGHHCVGAKVNNRIVPLGYELKNGDMVEILTSKASTGPSKDWLKVVTTSRAKNKIRQWFSKETREDAEGAGRELLSKALRKQGMSLAGPAMNKALEQVAKELNFVKSTDLLGAIGALKVSAKQVTTKLINLLQKETGAADEDDKFEIAGIEIGELKRKPAPRTGGVAVKGVDGVLVRLARCCNPVPHDEIIGFVTRGRGVSVHRKDCPNAEELLAMDDRLVDVDWDSTQTSTYQVEIEVEALDRTKLLRDVTTIISDSGVNILSAHVVTSRDRFAVLRFLFELSDLSQLPNIVKNIKKIDAVFDAHRVLPGR
ncbi:MAG: bifunctional (p)ppGpp synthetase/guanosine-3',5'-bis(diphosphate) 3'-pyrophosphohydrolase [Actinobacteria bacterium]|nr:MAG: bifunctional (p)ppGpp synthetase/guanosine-3',5'-bis(diphosphate) 3'-pyrophosphohydrolase [Actinomycetota bacterium]